MDHKSDAARLRRKAEETLSLLSEEEKRKFRQPEKGERTPFSLRGQAPTLCRQCGFYLCQCK